MITLFIPPFLCQFLDDPYLKSEERSCPVQLPLAVSGWGFKEEFSEPVEKDNKVEKSEEDTEEMEDTAEVKGTGHPARLVSYTLPSQVAGCCSLKHF